MGYHLLRHIQEKKLKLSIIGFLIILVLLSWSPWITKTYAEKKVIEAFEESQKGIVDGCGFNCEGCGIADSNKMLFGYKVNIKFKCGMKNYFRVHAKFVSFIGSVH